MRTPQSIRDYYVMTELFVLLHGNKDYCKIDLKKLGEKY